MKLERNTDGLKAHAQQKRAETIERTEKAIQQLIKDKQRINFNTVAEVAGVSKAWLYDEPDMRERIEHLRKQAIPKTPINPKGKMSLESQSSTIDTLKRRIGQLEGENKELAAKIKVAYSLAPQLQLSENNRKRLEEENKKLRQQLESLNQNALEQTVEEAESAIAKTVPSKSKLIPFPGERKDELQPYLDALRAMSVELSSSLMKRIASKPIRVIIDATEALEQAIESARQKGKTIKNPTAWFSEAIELEWKKNQLISNDDAIDVAATEVLESVEIEEEELASLEDLKNISNIFTKND
jgi:Family of unknown function (DUF6262)